MGVWYSISAKGFDERERYYILVARLGSNNSVVRNTYYKIDQVWELLLNIKVFGHDCQRAHLSKVAKTLSRSAPESPSHFGDDLRQQSIGWVQSLPAHLQLPIGSAGTKTFDRDVHQLHLPYLTTIIILHLRRSAAQDLPHALPPAILVASCIVRILRDILSRRDTRFLMPTTCWYAGTAYVSLLQACRIDNISKDASEGLYVLTNAVEQLQRMWVSEDVVRQGFDRLRKSVVGSRPMTG